MLLKGYAYNVTNCAKTFLTAHKPNQFVNKPFSYVVRLNDKIKIGSCNNLYNRIGTYKSMYKDVEILNVRGFPVHPTNEIKYHGVFAKQVARINNNSYHHDARNEVTILKSIKDLTSDKFKILNLDLVD